MKEQVKDLYNSGYAIEEISDETGQKQKSLRYLKKPGLYKHTNRLNYTLL